jgi:hypothetical protein
MKDRRQIELERRSIAVQQQANTFASNNERDSIVLDPLLDQVPEMGVEGLVATIDDRAKLLKALRLSIQKNKLMLKKEQYNN